MVIQLLGKPVLMLLCSGCLFLLLCSFPVCNPTFERLSLVLTVNSPYLSEYCTHSFLRENDVVRLLLQPLWTNVRSLCVVQTKVFFHLIEKDKAHTHIHTRRQSHWQFRVNNSCVGQQSIRGWINDYLVGCFTSKRSDAAPLCDDRLHWRRAPFTLMMVASITSHSSSSHREWLTPLMFQILCCTEMTSAISVGCTTKERSVQEVIDGETSIVWLIWGDVLPHNHACKNTRTHTHKNNRSMWDRLSMTCTLGFIFWKLC